MINYFGFRQANFSKTVIKISFLNKVIYSVRTQHKGLSVINTINLATRFVSLNLLQANSQNKVHSVSAQTTVYFDIENHVNFCWPTEFNVVFNVKMNCEQHGIPYCGHSLNVLYFVSWSEEGLVNRNMWPGL